MTAQDDARRLEEIADFLHRFSSGPMNKMANDLRSLAARLAAGPPSAGAVPEEVLVLRELVSGFRTAIAQRRLAPDLRARGWMDDEAILMQASARILSLPAQPAATGQCEEENRDGRCGLPRLHSQPCVFPPAAEAEEGSDGE